MSASSRSREKGEKKDGGTGESAGAGGTGASGAGAGAKGKRGHARNPALRSAARLGAVQALYQMDMAGTDLNRLVVEFAEHRLGASIGDGGEGAGRYHKADLEFFEHIVRGVVAGQLRLDPEINALLADGWNLGCIDSILRAILRCAAWELHERHDVPARVVINEYIDIARAFFEGAEPKVVNGVLDRLARRRRKDEMKRAGAGS
jgi:N utilization substance protein B